MGEFEVELSSGEGFVVDGGVNEDLDRIGRKVDTGRPVVSAAGRGVFA